MDANTENIKCEKNGQTKLFSQKQLDMIGPSGDGTYDGWIPQIETPSGIPEPTQLPIEPQKPVPHQQKPDDAKIATAAAIDPNGGLTINHEKSGDVDPNVSATDATGTDVVTPEPIVKTDTEATTTESEEAVKSEATGADEQPATTTETDPVDKNVKTEKVKKDGK